MGVVGGMAITIVCARLSSRAIFGPHPTKVNLPHPLGQFLGTKFKIHRVSRLHSQHICNLCPVFFVISSSELERKGVLP